MHACVEGREATRDPTVEENVPWAVIFASKKADQGWAVRWWWWCVGSEGAQPSLTGCGTERKSQVWGRDQVTIPFFVVAGAGIGLHLSPFWSSSQRRLQLPLLPTASTSSQARSPPSLPPRLGAWELQPAGGQLLSPGKEEVRLSFWGKKKLARCDELGAGNTWKPREADSWP